MQSLYGIAFAFVVVALLELYVLRRLRFDGLTVALVLSGTLLSVIYASYTDIAERNYDGPAQVEYIQALAHTWRPPDVFACVACGHPPLYYVLGAIWSELTRVVGFVPLDLRLQWLSLLAFFGFVLVALLSFRSSGAGPATLRLATLLLVSWPSSIIHSVRVHNDALASPLLLAAMYFLAQWDERGRERDFYAALSACVLSLLTKSTGLTVSAALLFFVALRLRGLASRRVAALRFVGTAAALVAAEFLAVGLRESGRPLTLCQRVFGHACDGRHVPLVPDTPRRFFSFDVRHFVVDMDALHAASGHDYFLNRLLKSCLFGVAPLGEDFAGSWYAGLAGLISVLLLVMVAGCLLALPFLRGVSFGKYRTYLVTCGVMLASLLAFRIARPNEYHEDFRHVFPVLVPFCLGYAKVVSRLGRFSPWWRRGGIGLALLMTAASVAFFARLPGGY